MTLKPWGSSERIVDAPAIQVEYIEFEKGGYSSIHLHRYKTNVFFVTHGALVVRSFRNDDGKIVCIKSRLVIAGQAPLVIHPNILHQFTVTEDGEGYEVYFAAHSPIPLPDDIERFTENGNEVRKHGGD